MENRLDLDPRRFDASRPPVLLLGGFNLVRALGLAGIPVIVASNEARDPVFASRYCKGRLVLPPADRPDAVLECLLDAGDRLLSTLGRRVPIMYGNDGNLELISAHREALGQRFLMLLNEPAITRALLEKHRFQEFARERGLPVPRMLTWEGEGDENLLAMAGPVLVKPRQKIDWHDSPLHERLFADNGKALVFADGRKAAAHPLVQRHRNQLLFQEYIPGDDRSLWSFHAFADEEGEVVASFVGRKLRTYPPITGESTFIEMACEPGVDALGREIAKRLPLRGPFKIDMKQDSRDGRLHVLEINARYTLWHYLGAVNGMNLAAAAYHYLASGKRPDCRGYRTTRRWVYVPLDYQAYRALAKERELGFLDWVRSALAPRNVYHVFSWTDPGPFLAEFAVRLLRGGRRGTERVTTWLRQWLSTAS